MLSLEEVKLYLRVDGDEEDALITSLIGTAKEICEQILRYPFEDFEKIPLTVKQAMLYCIANIYEKREGTYNYSRYDSGGVEKTIEIMKLILSNHRKERW